MKKTLLLAALCMTALSAAASNDDIATTIPLKNGATLHVFADGKMAMEDQYGAAISMEQGQIMETRDGRKLAMKGNEIARLQSLRAQERIPG